MLTVSALSRPELGKRLADGGILLRTGSFVTSVISTIPQLADGISLLYADYSLAEPGGFADFHLRFRRAGGLHRWWHPQVRFDYDGLAPFNPLPVAHAFPMFEWTMNWCVSSRAHRYLLIHAAVVEKDGVAVVMPAPPGSGKSTLCAALVCRGWRLLSDELTLVSLDSGELVPLPRPVSLKNASIGVMRAYAPEAVFSRPVDDTIKGTIAHMKAPAESIARAAERVAPAYFIFPKYEADAAPALAPIAQARAFMRVAENAFNYSVLAAEGFRAVAALVDATRSFDFCYSQLDDAMAVFDGLARRAP